MDIAIAGAHGKIGLRLVRLLSSRDDQVTGLVRNPDHTSDVAAAGGRPVVCDLERASASEIADAVGDADAVVFAAGAGPGSGTERKLTMDRDGAIKLLEATAATAARYVMVSAVGADAPPPGDGTFEIYLRAKADADAAVMASGRAWVIVRPGRLTDDPGTGTARIETQPFRGEISRDDVAAILAAVIADGRADGQVLYVNSGETPIDDALARLG
jgi:uncharacterized protein YbjT (DUF2867 family)